MWGRVCVLPGVWSWHLGAPPRGTWQVARLIASDPSPVYSWESMNSGKDSILVPVDKGAPTFSKVRLCYYQDLIFPVDICDPLKAVQPLTGVKYCLRTSVSGFSLVEWAFLPLADPSSVGWPRDTGRSVGSEPPITPLDFIV